MSNFIKLDKNNNYVEETNHIEIDYKKKYYSLYREICKLPNQMCEGCPLVKSCCNGCDLLKRRLTKLKNDKEWGLIQD